MQSGPLLDFPIAWIYSPAMWESVLRLDRELFTFINSTMSHPWLDLVLPTVTDLHKNPIFTLLIISLLLGTFVRFRGLARGLLLFFMCLVCLGTSDFVASQLVKESSGRLRPKFDSELVVVERSPTAGRLSFPSNHATNMFALAGFVGSLLPLWRWPLLGIAMLIAFSRVYNGAHYPGDVLFGAFLGALIGLLYFRLTARLMSLWPRQGPT